VGGCVPADANGNPPAGFVPEAANNDIPDMGHPQVGQGGGVAIAGSGGREVATARGGVGGRGGGAGRGGGSGGAGSRTNVITQQMR
jgi:hypothetical protein